jgi:hypothetical protein
VTVVKVIAEMDPVNSLRRETWVMLNETGKPVKAGPLESDGLLVVVGHQYDGKVQHRALVGGQLFRYQGSDDLAAARKHQPAPVELPREFRE